MYYQKVFGRFLHRILIFSLLGLFIIPAICEAQAKDIEQDHLRFYRSGTVLDVSKVLALSSMEKGTIKEVTVRYNMIRSNLEADWLYNGHVIGHTPMLKGVKKSIRFIYNQPLPGTIAVRFTGRMGQVQVSNVSARVIKIGGGGELIEESEIDKKQKYNLLSKIIKISPATKRKDIKLAYEVKEHLIQKIIEKNLLDEKSIRSNISKNNAISILAYRDTVTMSGRIKGIQDEAKVTSHLKKAAEEVNGVKYTNTDIYVIKPQTFTLLPFIPNVVGKPQKEAEELIEKSGFLPKMKFYSSYKEEYKGQEGRIVLQFPEARKQKPKGSEVNITVYNPPSIPNVVGKLQREAEEIIKQAGYQPEVEFQTNYVTQYQGQEGKVVLQRPEAGTERYQGSSITITVYNPSTLIPSVVGKFQKRAEELIEKSGYLPKVEFHESYKKEYQGQEGRVVSQSPEADTQMPQGSELKITVYTYTTMADLEIESISYQDPLSEGERQSFSMIVRNSGDAFPEKLIPDVSPISIRVGLWYKGPRDSDWRQFQFPHTGMINIKPGKTQTYTFQKDANNSLPSGNYLIRGIVDEHEQLKDKNFQNNIMEKEITIAPSSILVKSFPKRAAWGQKILLEISTGKDLKDPEHPVSLSVKFNDVEGTIDNTGKKTWREYTLSVVVPEGATSGPILVSGYGVTGRSKDNIIIFGPPTITEISPQAASVKRIITIKGTYFANFSEEERTLVGFPTDRIVSGEKQVGVTWISENEIRVKVPDEAKSGPLSVYTIVGSRQFSTTSETSFQILPRITGFSPKYGYVGKQVWIGGTSVDFERNPRVKFNGVETEIKKISGNTLEVIVPEDASTGKIEIITDEGVATSEEDFRVFASPTINSISPLKGPEGTVITIEGNDMDLVNQGTISIPSSNTGSSLEVVGIPTRNRAQVRIPSGINHPGDSKISVKIPPGFWSNKVDFELTPEGMLLSRPQIESLSPSMITSGDSVILKVIKLPNPEVGVISVYFNGVSGEVKEIIGRGKYFELIVKVPEGATSGKVTLSTYGIDASGGASVLIFGQPTVTGISPGAAPIGSYITIRGTEFVPNRSGNGTLVSFISTSGRQIEVDPAAYLGDTEIRVKVPKSAVTGPITVTTIVSGHRFTTTSEIDFIVE